MSSLWHDQKQVTHYNSSWHPVVPLIFMETQFHKSHFLDGETESGDVLLLLWGHSGRQQQSCRARIPAKGDHGMEGLWTTISECC